MTKEISHADASARVDTLRAQLASIEAELAAARQRRDDHECEAVLAGAEIDKSFRDDVDELQVKYSTTSNLIRTLEVRVEAILQKETNAASAVKRAAAEELIKNLMAKQHEKATAAIAAVLACNALFLEAAEIRRQVLAVAAVEFPGENRRVPPLPPSGPLTFLDVSNHWFDFWAEGVCAWGYVECIPDSIPGKQRYLNNHKAAFTPDSGLNAAETVDSGSTLISN
jgi:hypothetical protein